jgi:hypothetical protein
MSQSSFPADGAASSAKWYELYRSAMLELNDAEVPQRIREARRAIFDRAEEILTKSQTDEQRSLSDALQILSVLEKTLTKKKPAA